MDQITFDIITKLDKEIIDLILIEKYFPNFYEIHTKNCKYCLTNYGYNENCINDYLLRIKLIEAFQ